MVVAPAVLLKLIWIVNVGSRKLLCSVKLRSSKRLTTACWNSSVNLKPRPKPIFKGNWLLSKLLKCKPLNGSVLQLNRSKHKHEQRKNELWQNNVLLRLQPKQRLSDGLKSNARLPKRPLPLPLTPVPLTSSQALRLLRNCGPKRVVVASTALTYPPLEPLQLLHFLFLA